MFEEKVDLKHKINVESIKPHDLKRPSTHVPEQYEDTPEFRRSMNLQVHNAIERSIKCNCFLKNSDFYNIETSFTGCRKRSAPKETPPEIGWIKGSQRAGTRYKPKSSVAGNK